MNCLMTDTAEGVRVLLVADGTHYYAEDMKNAGAQTLMPTIDGVLSRAGISIKDIDIFGACIGPGSFTGLRIGLATVKTFCYALGKPCFAVNNLRLNSYNNSSERVISVANAGNNVCYIARFDGDEEVDGARCMTADDARAYIAAHPDCAVSTDLKLAGTFLGTSGIGERELAIAVEKHINKPITQKELLPLYIRKAQPERGEGDL